MPAWTRGARRVLLKVEARSYREGAEGGKAFPAENSEDPEGEERRKKSSCKVFGGKARKN